MPRAVGALLLAGAAIVALRAVRSRIGPRVRDRCVAACERMLDEMPESAPPKRLFATIETIRQQNDQILELLREGTRR